MRKSPKSELAREIEKKLDTPLPPDVPRDNESCMIAIDFMAYARKVAVSKLKLKTFGDFVKHLWQTFSHLSRGCSRLDIIFDLYIDTDAKSPAFGWRLQLSDSISSSPAEQAKSPAELGLTNFVIHISCKLLFHKRKTVHDLRNREIYEKSAAN